MPPSDESQHEEEEANYNNILYENNLTDEIDYFNENLPHINFYLKFQKKEFLKNFFNELEKKEKDGIIIDTFAEGNENDKWNNIPDETTNRHIADNCKEGDVDANNHDVLTEEGGFYIDESNSDVEKTSDRSRLNVMTSVYKSFVLSEGKDEHVTHLEENHEYTKKINSIFQQNKELFIFSIERVIENNDDLILQEYCFLCDKKKKPNKVLSSINIYICNECKGSDSNFRMISLTKLINKYSLNMYDLTKYEKQLALLTTKNPRGYSKQMKLYFLFQIKEIAIRKHGSMAKVKSLYHTKILNIKTSKSNKAIVKKNTVHKLKKPKSIYSKHMENIEKRKIICDNNQHDFHPPLCTNQDDNVYVKKCKICSYQVEYIQF
ncbi:DNA repair protein RAD14 [Plasmodium brasilianum]|uniref:DNA repair protein RAD14, putative n=2 Tax=Plasmodium (Plasmodium) TaxID=418103 RepID=A0A1A8X879_PLAMA|nr:DNA repair protein RAD14, putative [Plasmodium malariae]KAI4841241.1 DNA repair protein RAD14 [Plasmodium brasilianum]SBT00005.1 DNA repair protein RAD14, putative (RAD14) [Plasmodium malariae]SBT86928.1 DNA repair protein RAD14, putative [Plasmodium malariae]